MSKFKERTRHSIGQLSRKQVLALSRALKRQDRKLPKVDHCIRIAKVKGKYDPTLVRSSVLATTEVCHYKFGNKHTYSTWSHSPRRSR